MIVEAPMTSAVITFRFEARLVAILRASDIAIRVPPFDNQDNLRTRS